METRRHKPLDLAREPNPFEHSFSLVRPEDIVASASNDAKGYSRVRSSPNSNSLRPSVTPSGRSPPAYSSPRNATPHAKGAVSTPGERDSQLTPSIKLPPITAISGPVDPAHMPAVWGAESLRSGPLSPAMLGGPTATSGTPKSLLSSTPGAPRLGHTDPALHSGLTPYIAGEAHPTAGATRAFGPIRMPQSLVTPNLQAAMQATVNGQEVMSTPGGTLHIAPLRNQPQSMESRRPSPSVAAQTSLVTSVPEQQQPRSRIFGPEPAIPLASMPPTNMPKLPPARAKRSRQTDVEETLTNQKIITKRKSKRKNHSSPSDHISRESSPAPAQELSDNEGSIDPYAIQGADGQPLTEEEKRKQFLERNRIAALKCRQRKKKQLQELQERHDFMLQENERLRKDYMELREVALQARALLAAHVDCPIARANGVHGIDSLPAGLPTPSLRPLMPSNMTEAEYARKIIDAIPPASNGIPVHPIHASAGPNRGGRRPAAYSHRPASMLSDSHYGQSPRRVYYD
ncbi:Transcription factor [Coemansia sp. RSA 2050]|nr:Transcription factor [Coemansia sp. RSA 2050]KAJ2732983.1 Transcription factor [Coemansia sp. BCRC 34962]